MYLTLGSASRLVLPCVLLATLFVVPSNRCAGQVRDAFSEKAFQEHIEKLKERLPSDEFHIVIERPFVVIGDESPREVQKSATDTVGWAVKRLKKLYFAKDPHHIIDVWLFKDKESYQKYTWEVFQDKPTTPYGYYSAKHKALIMNIGTGGGTLVHEIVHPYMATNFPKCPSWFNEGLASLYEQSWDKDGQIWGYPNWRLRALQVAIKGDRVPPFKQLCETTTREFYEDAPRTNYAQARYLCYYLQCQGLLPKFYHEFSKSAADDPTGYETLKKVLGNRDMDQFKKEWEVFTAELKF